MATMLDRARDVLDETGDLRAGERPVAAVKAMLLGGATALARGLAPAAVGGAVGRAVGAGVGAALTSAAMTGDGGRSELLTGVTVVVTDRRVLLMTNRATSAKPKAVWGSFDRTSITEVSDGTTRVVFVELLTITIGLADGTEWAFEVPKPSTGDGRAVLAALAAPTAA